MAALHFAAFIEVGESVADPPKYFENNRDKAKLFFDALAAEGVNKIVFSSTAAVYGAGEGLLTESHATAPVNPYGQSKLEAETYLRAMPRVTAMALRYFNVAGAAPEAGLGEAHFPESHVIPRIILPLIGAPEKLCDALGLGGGFKIYGGDYATRDGSAVRDYVHVLDLAEAHVAALRHLLAGGKSDVINLGSATGYSVKDIVAARAGCSGPTGFQSAGDGAASRRSRASGGRRRQGCKAAGLEAAARHCPDDRIRGRVASQRNLSAHDTGEGWPELRALRLTAQCGVERPGRGPFPPQRHQRHHQGRSQEQAQNAEGGKAAEYAQKYP